MSPQACFTRPLTCSVFPSSSSRFFIGAYLHLDHQQEPVTEPFPGSPWRLPPRPQHCFDVVPRGKRPGLVERPGPDHFQLMCGGIVVDLDALADLEKAEVG